MDFWINTNLLVWFALIFSAAVFAVLKQRHADKRRPPGPSGWPIFGNIFDLGKSPHQNLYKLRFKYGPLVWLRLGFTNTLVIQSAKAAEELFKNHDTNFCDRKVPQSFTALNYNKGSLGLLPYGPVWRFQRKIITLGLMSNKKINETAHLRQKGIDNMIRNIEQDAAAARARGETGEVVIAHYVFLMAFNLMGNLVLSRDLLNTESQEGPEFYNAMDKVTKWGGKPNVADFFPFLKRLDPQRIKKNMEIELERTFNIVKRFVEERIQEKKLMKEDKNKDFLDALLEHRGDEKESDEKLSIHIMLIIILEMFFGGTETTSSTVEWVMVELLRSPESLRRVKDELNQVVKLRKVRDSDLDNLPFLKAVIKETMRLHPVIPLLVSRNTSEDTEFMGYLIPKDTQVFVNAWGIGRDPDVWDEPLRFKPQRFLGSDIDYKGQNYEFLPFGSGRRICVGVPLAHSVIHFVVASLLHSFDWELGSNSAPETIDMHERVGFTVRKLIPLKAIPKKRIMEEYCS